MDVSLFPEIHVTISQFQLVFAIKFRNSKRVPVAPFTNMV